MNWEIVATLEEFVFSTILWMCLGCFERVIPNWRRRLFAILIILSLMSIPAFLILAFDATYHATVDIGGLLGMGIGTLSGWYPIGSYLSKWFGDEK